MKCARKWRLVVYHLEKKGKILSSPFSRIMRLVGFSSRRFSQICDLSTTQDGERSSSLKEEEENPCADEDPTVKNLVFGSVENECTSNFFVGDLQITDRDVGSCMGGKTPFGSDPKGDFKSELQSPLEPPKEEGNNTTPLRCEAKLLVEE